jgi:endonuclease/exonuclease/phosphatase family metal-dependent hydrolase
VRRLCVTAALLTLAACGSESPSESSLAKPDSGAEDAAADRNDDVVGQDAADDVTDGSADVGEDAVEDVAGDATEDAMDAQHDASGPWAPYGLLSLNLHCLKLDGTSFTSHEDRFAAIAQAVSAENVGAIAAQEICSNASQDALAMLKLALESATGEVWSTAFANAHTAWQGTPDEAEEGVGLLVRGPVSDVQTLEYRTQAGLRRVAVTGRLPATLGGFRLVSVHLEFTDATVRAAQARETASVAIASADPSLDVLVAGDFNAAPGSPSLAAMDAFGFTQLTASLGPGRIDHVLAHRATAVTATDAVVVFDGSTYPYVSDHPGMLVRLAPATGESVKVTRLRADVDVGFGNSLFVRGDVSPLSWTEGWPAWPEPSGTWKLVLTELGAGDSFAYKFLRNDTDWQTGDDETGTGGQDHVVTPGF